MMQYPWKLGTSVKGKGCYDKPFEGKVTGYRGPYSVILNEKGKTTISPVSLIETPSNSDGTNPNAPLGTLEDFF